MKTDRIFGQFSSAFGHFQLALRGPRHSAMPSAIQEMLRVCPGLRGELLIMVSDALGAEIDVAHLQEIDPEKGGNEVTLAQKSLKSHSFSLVCARMPLDQWAFSLSALL